MESSLQRLLLRSQQFEDALTALLPDPPTLADSTDRVELAAASCIVSTVHALDARASFQVGAPTSVAAREGTAP